ncbi:HsdM family class I SAM-dependent methyltransferase [Epibacterium ulvae]|uniref:HsdM family class I SAM-dependent methyltransferase n=1 Tax=Epibacterium ulvae TaxID=1156985 RepID=UPI002492BDB9|nr:N-6 DNA methylase [Epibacterium ulvae]
MQSLAELSTLLSTDSDSDSAVSPTAINALIARLLYFYFLVDRKFITEDRLRSWGLEGIGIDEDSLWSLADTTALFARLDEVFNGSIFPLPQQHVATFCEKHVNQLRRVLRSGESADGQLSFFDYNFATIRSETLSAIYEMFLRNESADAGKQFGAFYTPPYVADYTLDRLEDQRPFRRGMRVLDPAAGSGVFLVGAYRRIVESSLPKGETRLPLEDLHVLMMQSIFAVELNETACHVAAFSLYLTMLDYVDPAEADDYTSWPVLEGKSRLFPPMLASNKFGLANIQAADFFSDEASGITCDVIVGNPPWVSATQLRSKGASDYLRNTRAPIGNKQVAELFTWKAYQDHLEEDGLLGLLLPQKSFVNVYSEKFSNFLRSETEIIGISDLAHLRYKLFRRSGAKTIGSEDNSKSKSARQSTAAIFLRKGQPKQDHQFWTFRPLLSLQPRSTRGRLWIVVHDWTQVHWHNQTETDENAWRRLFTCNQIDRHILKNMDEYVLTGRFYSLGALRELVGLNFTIKDNEKLSPQYVLSANPRSETYWRKQLGLENELFKQSNGAVPLPIEQLERSPVGARAFLNGHVVLMPRTCETAIYVEKPIATKSFVIGSYNQALDTPLSQEKIVFLKAVAAYMATDTFRYLCFVNGRRMTIDRANIELSAIKPLPWPFGGLGDSQLDELLSEDKAGRERFVRRALRLGEIHSAAIDEFSTLRKGFSDGATPDEALVSVSERGLEEYESAVLRQIDRGKGRYSIKSMRLENNLIATEIRYVGGNGDGASTQMDHPTLSKAISTYERQGASGITQSRYLWHSREGMTTVLIKPKEHLHWTLERAFSDADLIVAAAMSGIESIEAA